MAINLTGKSDATLVTAATRAGLATSPQSYQRIFEDVSKTYGETMQAVTQSWKEVAGFTAKIAAEAIDNSIYNNKREIASSEIPMSDEDGVFYIDKLQDIKERLKGNTNLKERLKIIKEREDLYAQLEMFGAERKFIMNALASGNIDEKAMGANSMELLNAIAASGTEKKNTSEGNYFAATEDPLTGEIMYALMKRNPDVQGPVTEPQPVLGANDKPIVIRAGDVEKSIILKNPQLPIDLTKVLNNVEKTASQVGGIYTDYERNKVRKQFVPFVETSSGLKQSLRANFGGLESSFYDELTNPGKGGSELSADIFNALKSALGTTKDGQIDNEGILKGIEDDDGKKGLSKQELINGYMFMSSSIMNLADEDVTREIFLNWAESKASEAWKYGSSKYKSRNPGGGGSDGTGFLTTKKGVNSGSLGYYVFPNYDSAKIAYDQFVLASQGKEAEFTIGQANYKFEIKGDNAYKWVETNKEGEKTVKGTTTELIGPRGFAITDSDFRKIEDFGGGVGENLEKFNGLTEENTIKIDNAYNMLGNVVQGGLAAGIFMQDDNDAATTLQALLPAGFVIKKAGAVSKFFGVDKLTITAPDGTDLGTYDFGYRDSDKALEESKRFNSNVVEGDYFRRNNIVLGNL
tara:strand:- start:7434 stop:9338 length:1905 start_codon:yes stop_codon:yes gene_type:complete